MNTLLKLSAGLASTLALATAAQAGCGSSMYCGQGQASTSSLPPISSYFNQTHSHGSNASHSSGASQSFTTVTMNSGSNASFGTSISPTYSGTGSMASYGLTSSSVSLGAGESLQPTNCSVNVDAPAESRVIGCYTIGATQPAAPVANTSYYRVVRPVVYVRYPVPVPVPYTVNVPTIAPCGVAFGGASRYGHGGFAHGGSQYGASSRYGYSYGGCR